MALSTRDLAIVQVVLVGLRAFEPAAGVEGLTGAADVSHLSVAELNRAEALLNSISEKDLAAALAAVDADIATATNPRRTRRAS